MAEAFDQDERRATLEEFYSAFNDRDLDAMLEHLAPLVELPDILTGVGAIRGRDAVRAYWQKQWQAIDPVVEPMRIGFTDDGKAHVLVDQLIRGLDGEILQNRRVEHLVEFDGPFIRRLTVIGLAEGEVDRRRDEDDDGDDDGGDGDGGGEGGPGGEG